MNRNRLFRRRRLIPSWSRDRPDFCAFVTNGNFCLIWSIAPEKIAPITAASATAAIIVDRCCGKNVFAPPIRPVASPIPRLIFTSSHSASLFLFLLLLDYIPIGSRCHITVHSRNGHLRGIFLLLAFNDLVQENGIFFYAESLIVALRAHKLLVFFPLDTVEFLCPNEYKNNLLLFVTLGIWKS